MNLKISHVCTIKVVIWTQIKAGLNVLNAANGLAHCSCVGVNDEGEDAGFTCKFCQQK